MMIFSLNMYQKPFGTHVLLKSHHLIKIGYSFTTGSIISSTYTQCYTECLRKMSPVFNIAIYILGLNRNILVLFLAEDRFIYVSLQQKKKKKKKKKNIYADNLISFH